jgi:hypothetical protein
LDDYLSFLAPIPVNDTDPSRHWGYRVLRLSGQFVHLWPTLFAGALACSWREMTPTSSTVPAHLLRPS